MIQKLDDKLVKIISEGENVYTEFKEDDIFTTTIPLVAQEPPKNCPRTTY